MPNNVEQIIYWLRRREKTMKLDLDLKSSSLLIGVCSHLVVERKAGHFGKTV